MASVFGHAILAGAVGTALKAELRKPKVFILGVICSVFPDADVLGFKYGIPYDSLLGHRGLSHSILFGLLFGVFIMFIFHHRNTIKNKIVLAFYYSICTISHGVLDGMTTGGMGVAYFSPIDAGRYFLPFRKIQVSPLSASRFFSEWGISVIKSEMFWIGLPSILFAVLIIMARRAR